MVIKHIVSLLRKSADPNFSYTHLATCIKFLFSGNMSTAVLESIFQHVFIGTLYLPEMYDSCLVELFLVK